MEPQQRGQVRRNRLQQPRSHAVTVKLSEAEKTAIRTAAGRRHLSLGAYVAEVALAATEGRTVQLSDTERELLSEMKSALAQLDGCLARLTEAMASQEATGGASADLEPAAAACEQASARAEAAAVKLSKVLQPRCGQTPRAGQPGKRARRDGA